MQTPVGNNKNADVLKRVTKQVIVSAFFTSGTFGAITLSEIGLKFSDNTLAARHTGTGLPIENANTVDIRVDFTITIEQS